MQKLYNIHVREEAKTAEVLTIDDLARKVRSYSPGADVEFFRRAYWFSSEAHGLQMRQTGEPFMAHPLAVASILADMRMDVTAIAAAILHDTIEDTRATIMDIRKRFGYEAAFLVDALTKLGRIEYSSKEMEQAENFRKMLLSMAEDIRVIFIKFADRLHNMRTLQSLTESQRHRIAAETLEIYAPLANRLGIGWLKTELEDLSFKHLMPGLYDDIARRAKELYAEQESYVKKLIKVISKELKEAGFPGTVTGRVKHSYGIYQKMQRLGVPIEQINDILGIRIITDTKSSCYAIVGLIHSLWKPVPGKFKDYIGVPKSNLYQSLHTTVIGPEGERVEFQIRTDEMHNIAEEGIAAHWKYKEKGDFRKKDDRYISWLRELLQLQKEAPDAKAFMQAVKGEVVPEVVYVFTPKGDIKELPLGSTPVDFAYAIHTQVGHTCIGARVNGRMVPLRHKLESGNTVEIITSSSQKPGRDWLQFVATERARARIKQWIRTEERKQSIELGTKLMETELRKHGMSPRLIKSEEMERVAKSYGLLGVDDLMVSVGYGKISPLQAINRLLPEGSVMEQPKQRREIKEQKGITIRGVEDILYHTAKCCFPVPGDSLVGFITRGRGVAVHRSDCQSLEKLAIDEARFVPVDWRPEKDSSSYARLLVDTVDRPGILASMTAAISSAEVNISRIEAVATQEGNAHIVIIISVKDRRQLTAIMQKIAQTEGVLRVKRS